MVFEIWCEADVCVANGTAARAIERGIDREVEVVGEYFSAAGNHQKDDWHHGLLTCQL